MVPGMVRVGLSPDNKYQLAFGFMFKLTTGAVMAVVAPVLVITASTTHTEGSLFELLSCVAYGVLRMLMVTVVLGVIKAAGIKARSAGGAAFGC